MGDIVEDLRFTAEMNPRSVYYDADKMMLKAADEIERLRAAADGASAGAANAARTYLAALDAEPEQDCWDTETGEEEPGAQRFASDWARADHRDRIAQALDQLRAAVGAQVGTDEDKTKATA